MKLAAIFLLTATLHVSAGSFSQKVTLSSKSIRLTEIMGAIQKQTGYSYLAMQELLDRQEPMSVNLQNSTLKKALEVIFAGLPLTYNIRDNDKVIFITRKDPVAAVQPLVRPAVVETMRNDIRGLVTDSSGAPLAGVSVGVKGTAKSSTLTDANGKYILSVPDGSAVLVFSIVGYTPQEVTVGQREVIDIIMIQEPKDLNEVVVVAFGKQKKTDMIGSVTTVNPSELKIPSSNLTASLAGRVAGVIAYQRSGEPGADNADFFVRGITTFGNNNKPLILIDGIELTSTDLARLQTDDIATFSIMKDATATSLYGARGANGVILVTTKQGVAGKAKVSLRAENSQSAPTSNVKLADPVTYMKLANEATATRNPLTPLPYLEEKIEGTALGKNPLVYPANDWRSMLFKDHTMNQRYNLNVSGGGPVARYYVAGSYTKDNGILKVDRKNNFNNNIDLKSYSMRANVNINLTRSTELIVRLSGNFDDYSGPLDGGADMYRKVMRANPVLFPAFYPVDAEHDYVKHIMFGNSGPTNTFLNPYADMVKGYKDESRSQMLAQFEVKQGLDAITKGLSFRTMINLTRLSGFDYRRAYSPFWYQVSGYDPTTDDYVISKMNETGTEYLGFSEGTKTLTSTFYNESMLNYNRTFDRHGVSGLLVLITRESMNANAGNLQQTLPFRNVGLSGRATYSFDKRYYGEFNFGYNGSERFAESKRFGFFPSAGVAWSVSNENFFQPARRVISNLRFRYTYGFVGNDQIGDAADRFFYLSNVSLNAAARAAVFGRDLNETKPGVLISRYANSNITWERATKQNMAMEISLFGKANIIAEYFTEQRDNILMSRASIPNTMGLADISRANLGKATGRGIDLSLDYQHSWSKDLWLSVRGNLTYAKSRYKVYEEPDYTDKYRSRVGSSLQQTFGYIAERLFVDDYEAANSPRQDFGGAYGGGDIKYMDVNRDGKINEADKVPIGNPTVPEIVYGFGFSLSYKKFDISAFFQGAANQSFWIDPQATAPFNAYYYKDEERVSGIQYTNQLLQEYADSYWSESNRNVYALLPRLSNTPVPNNIQTSTWYMRDATFLRLKQMEIGYTFPKHLLNKISATNLRIYVNGSNLLMFSKFKTWDAEMAGNGLGYPVQKVFNMGINVTFN